MIFLSFSVLSACNMCHDDATDSRTRGGIRPKRCRSESFSIFCHLGIDCKYTFFFISQQIFFQIAKKKHRKRRKKQTRPAPRPPPLPPRPDPRRASPPGGTLFAPDSPLLRPFLYSSYIVLIYFLYSSYILHIRTI